MLRFLGNTLYKSQAAVAVQNLLEEHGRGTALERQAADIANKLVMQAHADNPALFEGRSGKRPHKLALVAAALSKGVVKAADDRTIQLCLHLALGSVLLELSGKPNQYALTSNDHSILGIAQEVYLASAA